MNKKLQVAIALIFALISAFFVGSYLNNLEESYKMGAKEVQVLVAKKHIEKGVMLSKDMIEELEIPSMYVQPGAVNRTKTLFRDGVSPLFMSAAPISSGEQILSTKIIRLGQETGLSSIIPTGMRAFTITMNRSKTMGIIKPGNRIDIIATIDYYTSKGKVVEESKTVLQNVMVLAVANDIFGTDYEMLQKNKRKQVNAVDDFNSYGSEIPVTLAVSPEDAQKLALVVEKGEISFSLRAVGDDKVTAYTPSKMVELYNGKYSRKRKTIETGNDLLKNIKKQQKEAMELLNKYNKK